MQTSAVAFSPPLEIICTSTVLLEHSKHSSNLFYFNFFVASRHSASNLFNSFLLLSVNTRNARIIRCPIRFSEVD